ncbi:MULTISPECIES: trehalose-phosphatase [unclassified Arthrobacter]|uniref:trehalose-phosphatase n=1 Tax=unclassified Arthrobacter TaxID=235627 RepID=UPI001E58753D|nr:MULTISPECIES: trehalose-phosphatase [unclassified Arthrobacter]MCC9145792.1 trehalose-phosphatase [Arthrobacter sp. zg-Y919]MDK1277021.1 trehalose-phosphatase [Arthrobacter sp. zg.Y919]WIB03550.1 trehalose-phosphatase [Arthrobacter sp. zg-Y919]
MSVQDARLQEALETLSRTGKLLVALDFDGVLSPLVEHAEDARPLDGSAAAVRALATLPETVTAFISGRALDSLRTVATPDPETLLIGSHGAETWTGPNQEPLQLTAEQAELLARARTAVESVTARHPGCRLEDKPAGVVLHTRSVSGAVAAAATAEARRELSLLDGVQVTDGKSVLEASVVHTNKGEGIRALRQLTGATAVLFAGDDVTDERGFEALAPGDVGIKVGEGTTAAAYRVASPEAFTGVLVELARLRADATAS